MVALTGYEWFKIVHVMAAVLWVGGGAALVVYALMTLRQDDPREMASFATKAGLIGERIFLPLSLTVFGMGVAMVEKLDIPWSNFWILFGVVGWAVSAGTGALFLGPETKRLGKMIAERPPDDAETQRRIRRILLIVRLENLLLLAIVFVMVAKFT